MHTAALRRPSACHRVHACGPSHCRESMGRALSSGSRYASTLHLRRRCGLLTLGGMSSPCRGDYWRSSCARSSTLSRRAAAPCRQARSSRGVDGTPRCACGGGGGGERAYRAPENSASARILCNKAVAWAGLRVAISARHIQAPDRVQRAAERYLRAGACSRPGSSSRTLAKA